MAGGEEGGGKRARGVGSPSAPQQAQSAHCNQLYTSQTNPFYRASRSYDPRQMGGIRWSGYNVPPPSLPAAGWQAAAPPTSHYPFAAPPVPQYSAPPPGYSAPPTQYSPAGQFPQHNRPVLNFGLTPPPPPPPQ